MIHSAFGGLYDEHAVQIEGPEKGLEEHFQVLFMPGGWFFQVSGTLGDATAIGTWAVQEGDHFTAEFDALAQGDPTTDHFHVRLVGTFSEDGDSFEAHGFATGYDSQGNVIAQGEALNTGKRISRS